MSGRRWALCAALVAATLPAASALADADSIDAAYGPLAAGAIYAGAFETPTETEYVAFDVAAGQTVHFDVANTVQRCTSIYLNGCPLYATLIDRAGRQLGGEGSSAGTGPLTTYWPAEPIDWTFDAAGRYFVAMDSDGDLPTYAIRWNVVPPGAGTPGGGGTGTGAGTGSGSGASTTPGTPIVSLGVRRRQRGTIVKARVNVGRRLTSMTARLERPGAKRSAAARGETRLGLVAPGRHTIAVRLDAAARRELQRRGRIALRLRVVADPATGATQTVVRRVTVIRR